jgi:hypothetical protein
VSGYDRTRREKRGSQGEPTDLAHAIKDAGYVDSLGHHTEDSADETVIKVTKVVDADGVVRWRVALPSTQEWLSGSTATRARSTTSTATWPSCSRPPALAVRARGPAGDAAGRGRTGRSGDARRLQPGRDHGGPPRGLQLRLQLGRGRGRRRADRQHAHPVLDDRRLGAARRRPGAATRLGDLLGTGGYAQQRPNWTDQQPVAPGVSGVGGIHNAAAYNSTLQSQIDRVPPATQDDLNAYFIGDDDTYGYDTTYYSWQEK